MVCFGGMADGRACTPCPQHQSSPPQRRALKHAASWLRAMSRRVSRGITPSDGGSERAGCVAPRPQHQSSPPQRRALKHGATTTLRSLRDLRDVPPAAQGAAEGRGFSRRSKSSRTSPSPKATATLTIVGTGASSGGVVPRSLDPATHCSGNGHPPPSAAANNRVDTSNFQNDGRSPTPNRHDLKRRRRAFGATDDLESSRGSKSPLNARSLDLPSHQRCDGCPVPEGAQRPMGRGRPSQESRA